MLAALALVCAVPCASAAADPLRIGVLAVEPETPNGQGANLIGAARLAVEQWNAAGGVAGAPVELLVETCGDEAQLGAALGRLDAAGAAAVVAPLEPALSEAARRATRGKLACISYASTSEATHALLDELIELRFQTLRVAYVHDAARESRELAKLLSRPGPRSGAEAVLDFASDPGAKAFAKALPGARPELLFVDLAPVAAARFVRESAAGAHLTVLAGTRAFGGAFVAAAPGAWVMAGRSLESCPATESLRSQFAEHGRGLGPGAAEGYEALALLRRAVEAGAGTERKGLLAAMEKASFDGPRGRVAIDVKTGAIAQPLAVWRQTSTGAVPYLPAPIPLVSAGAATTVAQAPDPTFGVPFGTWRTRRFVLEDDTQQVVCVWATDEGFATIDDDLHELGLSTLGECPLFDHLVKEELMARVLAITNEKYHRKTDGTAVAGESLKISFSTRPPKKNPKFWYAWFGGDHPEAGGEAFGTFCRTYTRFIRRTIFQPHALTPPATCEDLTYIDGTYRFGSDAFRDKRAETIRALINGYAGSMALTTAHEVGHLCTLDHVTDDPVDIMNVAEGGGIDHSVAHFGASTWPRLVKVLGLVAAPRK